MLDQHLEIVVALISKQDVRQWDSKALADWAWDMAEAIMRRQQSFQVKDYSGPFLDALGKAEGLS